MKVTTLALTLTFAVLGVINSNAWDTSDANPLTDRELAELSYAAALTENLIAFMDENAISYTVDPEYPGRWAVPYQGENSDWIVVVSVGANYTVFVVEIIKIPNTANIEFYEWLLGLNFSMNQAKFGVEDGKLYFNVDIPTRVMDRVEYFETINSMVNYIDGVYPELLDRANDNYTEN